MTHSRQDTVGGACAFSAFALWGLFPLYFGAISVVPPLEVFAHRILWVAVTLFPLVLLLGRVGDLRKAFSDRLARKHVIWATLLLSVNWLIFIWAITNGHVLQSSLGYYINPLFNVLLGVVVLGETMRTLQKLSVALAAAGVGVMIAGLGIFPWIALSLAGLFAVYGLVRKKAPVDAITGLLAETLFMLPPTLLFLGLLSYGAFSDFGMTAKTPDQSPGIVILILLSGVITSLPLVLFTESARRLPLSVVGFFQYITPTGHFLLAIYVFDEPFTRWHMASFALIWLALGLYTSDAIRHRLRMGREVAP